MFDIFPFDTILYSTLIYVFVIVGIRWLGKNELGQLTVADFIFIMLISEVVGDLTRASHNTLWGGLVAAVTLMILNKLFKIIMYRSKKINNLMEGSPSILIRNGKINSKELRKNRINIEELEQAGREQGIGDISTIALAILEVDGKISILKDDNIKTSTPLDRHPEK